MDRRVDRRRALTLFAGLALCPLCAPRSFAEPSHWGYEGAEGPTKWGDLDAANRACSLGTQQSPINIGDNTIKAQLAPLKITWAKTADTIVNNGHTIQLNMGDNSTLSVGGGNYRLVQFHFHRPSEHTINGAPLPMEVHFVHQNSTGALAVVGVLMTTGKPNKSFTTMVLTMPNRPGDPVKADPKIDPNAFLPAKRSYYRYEGSLTTPPCGETVDWLLLTDPIQVAEADITSFARLYPMNARPVQKLDRRFVLRSP